MLAAAEPWAPIDATRTQVSPGQKLPRDVHFQLLDEGADEPRAVGYQELFEGKRVVLFGLPGGRYADAARCWRLVQFRTACLPLGCHTAPAASRPPCLFASRPTGAFTSVCSSKQLPEYNRRAEELRGQGVDSILCTAVNGGRPPGRQCVLCCLMEPACLGLAIAALQVTVLLPVSSLPASGAV